jgi:hypothetical protein
LKSLQQNGPQLVKNEKMEILYAYLCLDFPAHRAILLRSLESPILRIREFYHPPVIALDFVKMERPPGGRTRRAALALPALTFRPDSLLRASIYS